MYYSSDFDHSCIIRFSWIVKKGDWFSWTKWTTSFGFLFTDFLFSSVLLILWDLRPAQHATVLMFFFLSPLQYFSGDVGWGTLRTTRSSCEYHLVPQSFYTWWNSIGKLNFGENVSMECFCLCYIAFDVSRVLFVRVYLALQVYKAPRASTEILVRE